MKSGRKINRLVENPIDNILIDISEKIGNIKGIEKILTPNFFTLCSLIITLFSIYNINLKNFKIGAILYFVGYFFDCMDGNFARKHNMCTDFGDKLDHYSDIIKYILLILVLNKFIKNKFIFYITNLLFLMTIAIHVGCQEKLNKSNNITFLTTFKKFCKKSKYINITKYLSFGTFFLFKSLFIYFIDY